MIVLRPATRIFLASGSTDLRRYGIIDGTFLDCGCKSEATPLWGPSWNSFVSTEPAR